MNGIREFVTAPSLDALDETARLAAGLSGVEAFATSLAPRTESLPAGAERGRLVERLRAARVRRLHGAYWGSPTAFFGKLGHDGLRARFADDAEFRAYFGDGSGRHQFARWVDEFRLATEFDAEAYVFHLIDYATVDGAWAFAQSREQVLAALAAVLQQLLIRLDEAGLLGPGAPRVELETAGWGLEYGMQTADDAVRVLAAVDDPHGALRVGWDLNHLLHALGADPRTGEARFLLPEGDLDPRIEAEVRALAERDEADVRALTERDAAGGLVHAWVEHQLGDPRLRGRISSVHVSDCVLKPEEYFSRGRLTGERWAEQRALPDADARREFGLGLVLTHYDSHLPVGRGCLDGRRIAALLRRLAAENPGFAVLHELKLSRDLAADLGAQRAALGWAEP